jgi:hypothetical protein
MLPASPQSLVVKRLPRCVCPQLLLGEKFSRPESIATEVKKQYTERKRREQACVAILRIFALKSGTAIKRFCYAACALCGISGVAHTMHVASAFADAGSEVTFEFPF